MSSLSNLHKTLGKIISRYIIMNRFHIRYTCSGDLQLGIVDFIMRNAGKYIIAREKASREHIQCYVETTVVKKTWVNKFNRCFTTMDRRDKYVEPDKSETKRYVCKGKSQSDLPQILGKRGFTDEDITILHQEYWKNHIPEEIQNIPVSLPEIKEEKKKKTKSPTFMRQIRDVLEEEYPEKEWSMSDKSIVFKKLMYMLGTSCKNLDHIIISRMTYGVLNSLIKDKQEWLEYWYLKSFNEILVCDDSDKKLDEN